MRGAWPATPRRSREATSQRAQRCTGRHALRNLRHGSEHCRQGIGRNEAKTLDAAMGAQINAIEPAQRQPGAR